MMISKQKLFSGVFIFCVIFLAAFLRLYNTNWDSGFHLHPDERFLTLVAMKEKIPPSFTAYLSPQISTLNPNVLGFTFYVYGTLPLTLNFLLSMFLQTFSYDGFTLQGRILSGLFDLATLVLVYKMATMLVKKYQLPYLVKYFSVFFYAIAVLPIQLSHFFTVDLFTNFFGFAAVYTMLRFVTSSKNRYIVFSSICFGFSLACKINAIIYVPLLLLFFLLPFVTFEKKFPKVKKGKIIWLIVLFCEYVVLTYFSLRLTDPYLFQSSNVFDLRINTTFLQSLKALSEYTRPDSWYPPNVQWITKIPIVFSLTQLILFGFGIIPFIFSCIGGILLIKQKKLPLLLLMWVLLCMLIQAMQTVQTMRYFIVFYPFLAIFAAIGLVWTFKYLSKIVFYCIILAALIWPFAFFSIYQHPHTRVEASYWIYNNIPSGSTLLTEYWDDPLPLLIPNAQKTFNGQQLHVFDQDTPEKWVIMNEQLQTGDYLILSSNRGWGSISTVPNRYPLMSKWYQDLFAGKLPYKKIAEFTSYPSLSYLGIPIIFSDDFAEEAFTVYDHPKVVIFQKI